MSINVKFITVVVRLETILQKYPGGLSAYLKDFPDNSVRQDGNLAGHIFMSTADADEYVENLAKLGFRYIENGRFEEIAVIDEYRGMFLPCDWLDVSIPFPFEQGGQARCRLMGDSDEYK